MLYTQYLTSHKYIKKFYLFSRISAPYFMMIAVTGTLLYQLGNGPLWGRVVGDARNACHRHWWTNILYVNNYLTPQGSVSHFISLGRTAT